MKKKIIIICILLATFSLQNVVVAQDYSRYFRLDSAYVYSWNAVSEQWTPVRVQQYLYESGRLGTLLTVELNTRRETAKTLYSYNTRGRADTVTNYRFDDEWVMTTRSINYYYDNGLQSGVKVQRYDQGIWIEDRIQQNYTYGMSNRLESYESIYWRNNQWTSPTVLTHSYNSQGQLIMRVATHPAGTIDNRVIYEYNDRGQQTTVYTQYPAPDGWSNWNMRTTQYDACGRRMSQIQYSGQGPDWVPATKTVFISSFNYDGLLGRKVPICHNGNTIWVAAEAVPAHLRHGDCVGECIDERIIPPVKNINPPFTIFPNPARERITIRFDQESGEEMKRIELADSFGKLVRMFVVRDNSDLIIERGSLKPGTYYIRLAGKEVVSQAFIFE